MIDIYENTRKILYGVRVVFVTRSTRKMLREMMLWLVTVRVEKLANMALIFRIFQISLLQENKQSEAQGY